MLPEREVTQFMHDIVYPISIVSFQQVKHLKFYLCLLMETRFVLYDLDCNVASGFVVYGFYYLAERPRPQDLDDFVTVVDMVSGDDLVVPIVVIITQMFQLGVWLDFGSIDPDKPNLGELKYLTRLELVKQAEVHL